MEQNYLIYSSGSCSNNNRIGDYRYSFVKEIKGPSVCQRRRA